MPKEHANIIISAVSDLFTPTALVNTVRYTKLQKFDTPSENT